MATRYGSPMTGGSSSGRPPARSPASRCRAPAARWRLPKARYGSPIARARRSTASISRPPRSKPRLPAASPIPRARPMSSQAQARSGSRAIRPARSRALIPLPTPWSPPSLSRPRPGISPMASTRCGRSRARARCSSGSIRPPTPSPARSRSATPPASLRQVRARCGCRNRATAPSRRSILLPSSSRGAPRSVRISSGAISTLAAARCGCAPPTTRRWW